MVQKTLNWFQKFKLFVEPRYVVIRNMVITFVQAGFAVWMVSGYKLDKVTFGAVVGAGASAVWNLIIKPWALQHGYLKA